MEIEDLLDAITKEREIDVGNSEDALAVMKLVEEIYVNGK